MKGERSVLGRVGAANGTESEALSGGVSVSIVGIEGQQAYRAVARPSSSAHAATARNKKRGGGAEKQA
jgi:hypothetical protein